MAFDLDRSFMQQIGKYIPEMKPGDIVKFKECKEPGDAEARFMVLENRGDRVLVKPFLMFVKQEILPTFVYLISELEIVK